MLRDLFPEESEKHEYEIYENKVNNDCEITFLY